MRSLHALAPAPAAEDLLRLPGIGPCRARLLREQLGIASIEELRRALADPQLDVLPGFGPLLMQRLRRAAEREVGHAPRMPREAARTLAADLAAWLHGSPETMSVTIAGGLRRGLAMVEGIDLLAVSLHARRVIERFIAAPDLDRVIARSPARVRILLRSGAQANLRIARPSAYGVALHDMTGSIAHVQAIRRRAAARGLRVTEHGLFRRRKRTAGETEESIYAAVGLPFVPPDRRDDGRAVEQAETGRASAPSRPRPREGRAKGRARCRTGPGP